MKLIYFEIKLKYDIQYNIVSVIHKLRYTKFK